MLLDLVTTDSDAGETRATLVVSNTGVPLDAAGVASLASMRASSKTRTPTAGDVQRATAGRFGVGFAAVRSVSDEVTVASTSGAVTFSLTATIDALVSTGAPSDQWQSRGRWLPVLRLPFPSDVVPVADFATSVSIQLRDNDALSAVRAQLAAISDTVLLGLPALRSITITTHDAAHESTREVADVEQRWRVLRRTGTLTDAARSDDTVDDAADHRWSVTVAFPLPEFRASAVLPGVLLAPTPTMQLSSLPAVVIASLPLDATRRHLRGGPRADAVITAAAQVYADSAELAVADGDDIAALIPTGTPLDFVDLAMREQIREALTRAAVLHRVSDGVIVRPMDAVTLTDGDYAITAAMSVIAPALVSEPSHVASATGAELRSIAEIIDDAIPANPAQARRWYTALAGVRTWGAARESLARLRVPLADGRVVAGARGVVVTTPATAAMLAPLVPFGLRIVHPDAASDFLLDIGATDGSPAEVLGLPEVAAAITAAAEAGTSALVDDWPMTGGFIGAHRDGWNDAGEGIRSAEPITPAAVTAAVLGLVAACIGDGVPVPPAASRQLTLLRLRDADGVLTTVDALVFPGSIAATILDRRVMTPVAANEVQRWGQQVLVAVGVRDDLVVIVAPEVAPADADLGLLGPRSEQTDAIDGWDDYLAMLSMTLGRDAVVELVAVADLDAIVDWPAALAHMGGDPVLRAALVTTVRWRDRVAPSYTAWWLREVAEIGLDVPFALDSSLVGVLATAPTVARGLDRDVQRALGGCATLAELDPTDWELILESWSDPTGVVSPAVAVAVWRALADLPQGASLEIASIPAISADGQVTVVPADDAAVADSPMWWQRTDVAAMVPAAGRSASGLADLLDLPLASELAAGRVDPATGESADVPPEVTALLVGAPLTWCEHVELWVDGAAIEWWVDGDGPAAVVHAVTTAGLAKGLCQAAGRWRDRAIVELALGDPSRVDELMIDAVADSPTPPPSE